MDIYLGALFINLSYQDIISFLKSYIINKLLIEKVKALNQLQFQSTIRNSALNSVCAIIENQKSSNIKLINYILL